MQFLLCSSNNDVSADSPLRVTARRPTPNYALAGRCWLCRASEPSRHGQALPSPSRGGGASDPSAADRKAKKIAKGTTGERRKSHVKRPHVFTNGGKKIEAAAGPTVLP